MYSPHHARTRLRRCLPLNSEHPVVGQAIPELKLLGGLPVSQMPKEGSRMWGHQPVTVGTYETVETLLVEGTPSVKQQLSLYRAFQRWRTHQLLKPSCSHGEALAVFGAYLSDVGLKSSTCACYVRTALKLCQREPHNGIEPQWYLASDILKAFDRRAASEPVDHAPDIDEDRALEILRIIKAEDVRFVIWLMCNLGARVADLQRLENEQIYISQDRIYADFRVTKSATSPSERYSIDVDLWIPFEPQWSVFMYQQRPISTTCDRVNKVLEAAGCPERTYSFRRLFINRVIDRFTENGITNWCKVCQLTGHQQVKNVKASYNVPAPVRARRLGIPSVVGM